MRSHTQPSLLACFSLCLPLSSSISPMELLGCHTHTLSYQCVNACYCSHDSSVAARATSQPPAWSCKPAAGSTGTHSPAAGWVEVRCLTPPLHSLPDTCFTKIAQRSGCSSSNSSSTGWCLTPNLLGPLEIVSQALGQVHFSNKTAKTFTRAHKAAAPLSSHLRPYTTWEGVLAFCSCENTPACTREVFPTNSGCRHIRIPLLSPPLILTRCNTDQLNFIVLLFIEEHLFLVPSLMDVLSVLYPIESSVKLH